MKLIIKGGTLEAEIQGNPLEKIQQQLSKAIERQDKDIDEIDTKLSDNSAVITKIKDMVFNEIPDKMQEDISGLGKELTDLISEISDKDNEKIKILGNKIKQLSALLSNEGEKITNLKSSLNDLANRPPKIIKKTFNKTIVKQEPVRIIHKTINHTIVKKVTIKDKGIDELHKTISNIKRVPIEKYPKPEIQRQRIMQADYPVHSSKSNMQDKLNAVPRMPI